MGTVEQAVATFERNIEAQTGRAVGAWVALVRGKGLEKHGAMVAWLKGEHGLSHGHANQIAKRTTEAASAAAAEEPIASLYAGKESLRAIHDRLVTEARALGPDVEIAPKKANVSVRRAKQFALIQPTTRTRVDLGLILKGVDPAGRLEPSGSFNAMFTHRVKLESVADIDGELLDWLAAAYGGAG